MQATVRITKAGQVSVPCEIRQAMMIEDGDLVTIDVIEIARKVKDWQGQEEHVSDT